jgi:hypothetical protein
VIDEKAHGVFVFEHSWVEQINVVNKGIALDHLFLEQLEWMLS